MNAELLMDERHVLDARSFVEMWFGVCRDRRAARFIGSSIGWRLLSMGSACCATTMKRARVTTGT